MPKVTNKKYSNNLKISSEVKTSRNALKGVFLLILATSLLALGDGLAKQLSLSLPAIQILWARFLFFFIPLFIMTSSNKIKLLFISKNLKLQFVRALLAVISAACMIIALKHIPLGTATAILFTAPIIVMVLSSLILKEHINLHLKLSVVSGFAGVIIITNPFSGLISWYLLLPLVTAFCFALYQIVTRILSVNSKATDILLQTGFFGTLITTILIPFHWSWPTYYEWFFLVSSGLIHGLAHFMLIRAFSLSASSFLAPFLYFQLISAMVFGFIFFNELPTTTTIFGTFLIVISGVYVIILRNR